MKQIIHLIELEQEMYWFKTLTGYSEQRGDHEKSCASCRWKKWEFVMRCTLVGGYVKRDTPVSGLPVFSVGCCNYYEKEEAK